MLFSQFFKQPKPNKFGYTPLYFDPKKEKLRQRIREVEMEHGKVEDRAYSSEDLRERFADKMTSSRKAANPRGFSTVRNANTKASTRVLVLLAIAAIIIYWQFFKL